MITEEEYRKMLARVAEISVDDPDDDSELGREMLALLDAIQEYERANFPEFFKRE
jgi:hypothetical protein